MGRRTTKPREPPLFQQSRTLEKQIQEQEQLVKTLQKEQAGVKAMVDTYKRTPNFSDAKTKAKADTEYETVSLKLSQAEGELSRLKGEEQGVKQRLPTKAKTIRIKKRKNSLETKDTNTDPPPAPLPAGSSVSQPEVA